MWNKPPVKENFEKGLEVYVIFLSVGVKILVLNLHVGAKKIYSSKIIFQARFKRVTVNNSGGKETQHQHASHRNFWNF